MFSSVCPNCGAPIKFYSAASTTAVCGFCKSTIARAADELRLIGKQAQLLNDFSQLQISTEGRFQGRDFSVIGRIQMRYGQGFWNEWYLLFTEGATAWLSDSSGQYAVLEHLGKPANLPAFDSLSTGQGFTLNGQQFSIVDKRSAQCVAAEGELPFAVDSRWEARTLDCRSGEQLITLDYSDGELPTLYKGVAQSLEQLHFKRLRDLTDRFSGESTIGQIDLLRIESLDCKSCGTGIKLVPSQTHRVVCPKCKSELRLQEGSLLLEVERAEQIKTHTALAPGDTGKVHGFDWTVLGVLLKHPVGDSSARWEEYLLYNESQGLRWASNTDGAWQWIRVINEQPEVGTSSALLNGQRFALMDAYKAQTSYVAGAFNWEAKVGDQVSVQEFRAADKVLSMELTAQEQTWSLGQTLNGYDLLMTFGKRKEASSVRDVKVDEDDSEQHFLLTPSIVTTALLLMILMPAWFVAGLDAPIEEMIFGILALWAPLWISREMS